MMTNKEIEKQNELDAQDVKILGIMFGVLFLAGLLFWFMITFGESDKQHDERIKQEILIELRQNAR